jgi:hypothetical protein
MDQSIRILAASAFMDKIDYHCKYVVKEFKSLLSDTESSNTELYGAWQIMKNVCSRLETDAMESNSPHLRKHTVESLAADHVRACLNKRLRRFVNQDTFPDVTKFGKDGALCKEQYDDGLLDENEYLTKLCDILMDEGQNQ